jgi:hypothetical protein
LSPLIEDCRVEYGELALEVVDPVVVDMGRLENSKLLKVTAVCVNVVPMDVFLMLVVGTDVNSVVINVVESAVFLVLLVDIAVGSTDVNVVGPLIYSVLAVECEKYSFVDINVVTEIFPLPVVGTSIVLLI